MKGLRIDLKRAGTIIATRFLVYLTAALLFSACVSTEEKGPVDSIKSERFNRDFGVVCNIDKFKQISENERLKKVDFLFVMDTSGSMQDDWERVANDVRIMVQEVPNDVDAHYAVILGHVGKYSGKLFAGHLQPKVLKSSEMDQLAVSQSLHRTFVDAMKTSDAGSGETLFYSLYQAVTKYGTENQQLGFFRSDAALSIMFMSDEHEIGAVYPKLAGLPGRCDESFEEGIRKNWYLDKGIDIETTYQAVKTLKGDMPFSTHAIVNITAEDLFRRNPKNARCLYDSLGYGFFEMVNKSGGVLFSIQENRSVAMQTIGQYVNQTLQLVHDFKLSWSADTIDPATIIASVDATQVAHQYNASTNIVHVENAGAANSNIEVSYCSPNAVNQWSILGFRGVADIHQITLVWQTPEASTTGIVRWGLSESELTNETSPTAVGTNHSVTVDQLAANSIYYFQAQVRDEIGREQWGNIIQVSTLAETVEPTDPTVPTDPTMPTDPTVPTDPTAPTDPTTPTDPAPSPSPVVENNWSVMGFDGTTTATTATMIWQTPGVATTGTLRYGLSADNLTLGTIQAVTAQESQIVTVEGLSSDTIYFFQVDTVDANGKIVSSTVISKRTKAL